MRWRPLAVALLAVLAGCSGGFGGGSGGNATVTPAPVPDENPDNQQHRGEVVPGIEDGEVTDVDLLARAHVNALHNRSYTWREQRVVNPDPGNGSGVVTYRQVARVESPYVYLFWTKRDQVRVGPFLRHLANYTEYADGDLRHLRYRFPASATYEYEQDSPIRAAEHPYIGQEAGASIRRYLDLQRTAVTETTVDGRRHYRIRGRTGRLSGVDRLENYTATALVTREGFVRSLTVEYRTTQLNDTRQVTYTYEYERLNGTTVEEPDWVRERGFGRGG